MTLRRVPVPIPLGGGVDEATSDVLFEAPLVRELVNGRIPKVGSIGKRYGEDALPSTLPSTAIYGEHNAIAEHEGRAVVLSQLGAYFHDAARGTWASAGAVQPRPSLAKCDPIVRQNNGATEPEIALVTVGGKTVACVVWSDVDLLEGLYLFAEVPSDGGALRVLSGPTKFTASQKMVFGIRLAVIGTTVYAIAADTQAASDIWCSKCDVSASYAFSAATSVSPGWGAGAQPIALLSDNSAALWAVLDENPGGTTYSIRKLDTSFVETASQTGIGRRALDAIRYGTTIVVICSNGSIDDCADSLAGAPTNHVIIVPAAGGLLENASSYRATICEAGSGTFFAAWERQGSATSILNLGVAIASISAVYGAVSTGIAGTVKLAGRAAYRASDGLPMLPVCDIGPSSFTADAAQNGLWRCGYVAKPATDASAAYTLAQVAVFGHDVCALQGITRFYGETLGAPLTKTLATLPSLVFDGVTGAALLPYKVVDDATVDAFVDGVHYGIDLLRLHTVDAPAERHVSSQSLRVFGGGAGASYVDGVVHAETTPPPNCGYKAIATDTDASVLYTAGTAATDFGATSPVLILAPRWRDERGNIHRAPPIAAGDAFNPKPVGTTQAQRCSFPRLFPNTIRGDKGGQRYEVEVYAGTSSSGPFYYMDVVTPRAHPTYPGLDYICIDAQAAGPCAVETVPLGCDFVAAVNVPLLFGTPPITWRKRWTDSGELAHVPPPAAIDLCSTQQRVWLLGAEAGRLHVFSSKQLVAGYAPEFPTALVIRIPDEGGEATAIAALGDRVIVFKERSVYAVFGDPGDNTGANGNVTVRLLNSDVGCKEPQSVVEGPFGVLFRSAAGGFHLLTPGEQVQQLPALEDSLGDYAITGGVLVADRKEVRWAISTGSKVGKTLVWDYQANAWLTHELASATVAACTVGGVHHRIAYAGTVYQERETWSTSLDVYVLKITSAWLKFSGSEMPLLKGFRRVWKTVLMLRWYSGDLIVRVGYDYEASYTDSRTWTIAELTALAAVDGLVHLEVQHTRQKCEAVRFQLEESNPGGQSPPPRGQGFTVLGAVAEVGVKPGGARPLPSGSRK